MKQWLCSGVMVVLVSIANTPLALSQQATTAAGKAAIRALEDRLVKAVLAKDWKALADLYTDKGVLMPPNAPVVVGGQAIAAWFAGTGLTISAFTTSSEAIEVENNLAINRGVYTLTFTAAGMA